MYDRYVLLVMHYFITFAINHSFHIFQHLKVAGLEVIGQDSESSRLVVACPEASQIVHSKYAVCRNTLACL